MAWRQVCRKERVGWSFQIKVVQFTTISPHWFNLPHRPLDHPGEYARIVNGTKSVDDPEAQPLYIASGGMFYPLIWDRQQYENFCCPREICLNGRKRTSCDELSSMARAKGIVSRAEIEDLNMSIASCTQEMCHDTYAYTVWLSVWKDTAEDNL